MNQWEFELLEDKPLLDSVRLPDGVEVRKGDRVRLRPGAGGDVMDLALTGRIAVVESLEQDYEGLVHLSVVVEDDPGADIGNMRQPGHRFFFHLNEVEAMPQVESAAAVPRILIAGIGNVFFGDDGFGVEVVARLSHCNLPVNAQSVDFGIRSYDLALALTSGRYETAILVDASSRGDAAGTIYVFEPDLSQVAQPAPANAHSMNPDSVLQMARNLGALPTQILVVACEPETLGGHDGQYGLSATVSEAADRAVQVVESLVTRISSGERIDVAASATADSKEKTECR